MSKFYQVSDCELINVATEPTKLGNILLVKNIFPDNFQYKRIYYIYDVPSSSDRGGHAHKELFQLILAVKGSFMINLFDGTETKRLLLNNPSKGLLLKPGIWRDLYDFSGGSVCLVLASAHYLPSDYILDYKEFIIYREENK